MSSQDSHSSISIIHPVDPVNTAPTTHRRANQSETMASSSQSQSQSSRTSKMSKKRRRLRRPGPPDRLGWLGGIGSNESGVSGAAGGDDGASSRGGSWDNGINFSNTQTSNGGNNFGDEQDKQSVEEAINLNKHRSALHSKGTEHAAIDLTADDDDEFQFEGENTSMPIASKMNSTKPSPNELTAKKRRNRTIKSASSHDGNFSSDAEEEKKGDEQEEEKWECQRCTLLNPIHLDVCEICDTRRKASRRRNNSRERKYRIKSDDEFSFQSSGRDDGDSESSERKKNKKRNGMETNKKDKKISGSIHTKKKKGEGQHSQNSTHSKQSSHPWNWTSLQSTQRPSSYRSKYSSQPTKTKKKTSIPTNQSTAKTSKSTEMWISKHAPQNKGQLCVAPKKIEEVRQWLSSHVSFWQSKLHRSGSHQLSYQQHLPPETKMMVLVGSPGIGKSAMVEVLAKELGMEVLSWNDAQVEYTNRQSFQADNQEGLVLPYQSQLASFEEFLMKSGIGMQSLEVASLSTENSGEGSVGDKGRSAGDGALILIEETPNLFNAAAAQAFRNIMERHLQRTSVPTVLIFSDVQEGKHRPEDLERLIPLHSLQSQTVEILQIQPVTKSKMKKCLEAIAKVENLGRLPSEFVEELHLSSGGDLRHAILTMQFQYGSGADGVGSSNLKSTLMKKSETSNRDVKLSSFHALGKLLYAKRRTHPPGMDPMVSHDKGLKRWDDGRAPLAFEPENVLDRTDMGTGSAMSFLSYHCVDFFTDVTELSEAFERISDSGVFLDRFCGVDGPFPMDYASSIGGRAVPGANKHPAPYQFRQFTAPKIFEVMKKQRENQIKMDQLRKRISLGSAQVSIHQNIGSAHQFVTDALPYVKTMLPEEINYALANLHSYAKDASASTPAPQIYLPAQNSVLLEDDLVDEDSVDG